MSLCLPPFRYCLWLLPWLIVATTFSATGYCIEFILNEESEGEGEGEEDCLHRTYPAACAYTTYCTCSIFGGRHGEICVGAKLNDSTAYLHVAENWREVWVIRRAKRRMFDVIMVTFQSMLNDPISISSYPWHRQRIFEEHWTYFMIQVCRLLLLFSSLLVDLHSISFLLHRNHGILTLSIILQQEIILNTPISYSPYSC